MVAPQAILPARRRGLPRPARAYIVVAMSLAVQWSFLAPAAAEVWAYVDAAGQTHLAPTQVDERYHLFYKGDLAGPAAPSDSSAAPAAPGAGIAAEIAPAAAPAGRYAALIDEHARRQAVDPVLVRAIIAVESGFQPAAVSPKGALGLMQVMPATGARYGVGADAARKLLDPATNLQVGTRYLRDLLARYEDDITLALAAYNAGELAVERYRNRVPPYPETMAYVQRVQALLLAWRPPPVAAPPVATPSDHGMPLRGRLKSRLLTRSTTPAALGAP